MYVIKHVPEDFVVKEIPLFSDLGKGEYSYFLLHKENIGTLEAIGGIAKKMGVPLKHVGFAGNKDKKAVTEQYISIKGGGIKDVSGNQWKASFVGQADEPIRLGYLKGNGFSLTVRNLTDELLSLLKINIVRKKIPNFFGKQRFSRNNVSIGRAIVKGEFSEALSVYLDDHSDDKVREHFYQHPHDAIGALRCITPKLLKLFVHAYQSYLFNEALEFCIKKRISIGTLPLVGFSTSFESLSSEMKGFYEALLEKEKISLRDFIIRSLPSLSVEGEERKTFVTVEDLKVDKVDEDEFFEGKKKVILSFSLPKNAYATVVIDYLFNA
tara:strand:+ start:350 stop:1324 length:975 start_codon:yes stop_codon:yes gene_type:complete